jgi:anti-anti-sigma factor
MSTTEQRYEPLITARTDGPALSVTMARHGPVTTIIVRGELDMSTADQLTDFVRRVARDHPARVVLDMTEVSFFCAAGITALIQARDMVTSGGGQLRLRSPSRHAWRLLTLTHTEHLFPLDGGTHAAAG